MSTTPPEGGAPIPPGFKAGDYVPFNQRLPDNPSAIAGEWADPARQAQVTGTQGGRKLTADEQYRAIYGADAPARVLYAPWILRVLGYLVDYLLSLVSTGPLIIGYVMLIGELDVETNPVTGEVTSASTADVSAASIGMIALGAFLCLAFNIWNTIIRQGRTGYSLGKTVMGIQLVRESDRRPMGAILCFVRQLAHIIDGLICYLGYLWPLWDSKRQTLADKVMGTVVIVQPQEKDR